MTKSSFFSNLGSCFFLFVFAMILGQSLAHGQSPSRAMPYNELMILSFDEMEAFVRQKMAESQTHLRQSSESQAVESLRSALQTLLSRPDQDNTVARLIHPLRTALLQLSAFEDSLASLASEALSVLQNSRLPVELRATQVFLLENMMAELRPLLGQNPEARKIFAQIRDAQIKIPPDVTRHRRMTGMFGTPDLSLIAKQVLEQAFPDEASPPRRSRPTQPKAPRPLNL